jgi:RNA polymerase sigma-70 factor (ECF subfamily)
MLDGLPAVVRKAFLLSQLDGLKQAEIAQELGISLASVKRHLVKAGMHCIFAVAP